MRWLGLARRSLDIAVDRAETRELFGSPLEAHGLAQHLIAESVIDLETSDAIIAKTAALLEADPKAGSAMSSIAKVHCSEAVYRVIDRAVQLAAATACPMDYRLRSTSTRFVRSGSTTGRTRRTSGP